MFTAPSGERLDPLERPAFEALVTELRRLEFDQNSIQVRMTEFVALMATICATEEARWRMADELDGWVRWHRISGYFLSFIFQAAMAQADSPAFIAACVLFSNAQTHFADGLSLDSLENAYKGLFSLGASGRDVSADTENRVQARILATFRYYRALYSDAPSDTVNPLSANLYFDYAWGNICSAFPEINPLISKVSAADLERMIGRCDAPSDVYCRVVALRVLGLVHDRFGNIKASRAAYDRALTDALAVDLDAEIGHLHRLFGNALRRAGEYDEADLQFNLAFSCDAYPMLQFYQALAQSEIGDCNAHKSGCVDPAKLSSDWKNTHAAYSIARDLFERQVSRNVLPIGRAIQQQMFRSYADNAIQVAYPINAKEVLIAIEAFGPRYATDIVAESRAAAATLDAPNYERYRKSRALYHADLATRDESVDGSVAFVRYLKNVLTKRADRLFYTRTRNALAGSIANAQLSHKVIKRVAALRIPSTVFLVFNVGASRTHAVLIDVSNGSTPVSTFAEMPEQKWKAAHDVFREAVASSKTKKKKLKRCKKRSTSSCDFTK